MKTTILRTLIIMFTLSALVCLSLAPKGQAATGTAGQKKQGGGCCGGMSG